MGRDTNLLCCARTLLSPNAHAALRLWGHSGSLQRVDGLSGASKRRPDSFLPSVGRYPAAAGKQLEVGDLGASWLALILPPSAEGTVLAQIRAYVHVLACPVDCMAHLKPAMYGGTLRVEFVFFIRWCCERSSMAVDHCTQYVVSTYLTNAGCVHLRTLLPRFVLTGTAPVTL